MADPNPTCLIPVDLPRCIHDELQMNVALHGYNQIRGGLQLTQKLHHEAMETFYHGK